MKVIGPLFWAPPTGSQRRLEQPTAANGATGSLPRLYSVHRPHNLAHPLTQHACTSSPAKRRFATPNAALPTCWFPPVWSPNGRFRVQPQPTYFLPDSAASDGTGEMEQRLVRPRGVSTNPGRTSQVYAPSPPPPSRAQALLARADKLLAQQHLKLQPSSRATAADASESPRDEVKSPSVLTSRARLPPTRSDVRCNENPIERGVEARDSAKLINAL